MNSQHRRRTVRPSQLERSARFKRRLRLEALEERRVLATFTVVDVADAGAGTLREAIEMANSNPGHDVIEFAPALSGLTLTLTSDELEISDSLTIDGSSVASRITIDASGADATPGVADGGGIRIFNIVNNTQAQDIDVSIDQLNLTGGDVATNGGALWSEENLTLTNAEIRGNFASGKGGGLYLNSYGNFHIEGVTIDSNEAAAFGGGIWAGGGSFDTPGTGIGKIVNSQISGNEGRGFIGSFSYGFDFLADNILVADNLGGGMGIGTAYGAAATISSSTISGTSNGSGLSLNAGFNSLIDVEGCLIADNHATSVGGGVSASVFESLIQIRDTTIRGNSAAARGGGLFVFGEEYGSVDMNDSTIAGNSSVEGGGLYGYVAGGTILRVMGTTIAGNEAVIGGGIRIQSQPLAPAGGLTRIEGSTISGNSATTQGGGAYFRGYDSEFVVSNSTVSGNASVGAAGGIAAVAQDSLNTLKISYSTIASNVADSEQSGNPTSVAGGLLTSGPGATLLSHTIVGDNTRGQVPDDAVGNINSEFGIFESNAAGGTIAGTNNQFGVDPQLLPLSPNGGNTQTHALQTLSPALDAGDPTLVPGMSMVPEFDQRGSQRIAAGRIDIGAYERTEFDSQGDFNDDGMFDCLDLDALTNEIVAGTDAGPFDLTGDGLVDAADLAAWLVVAGEINLGPGKAYLPGDANLDGTVNGGDFLIWNANKFSSTAAWCMADFNADGQTDGSDFLIWNANKFQNSDVGNVLNPMAAETSVGFDREDEEREPRRNVASLWLQSL